jgi:antitoxin component YwqK of YwqJK toxin-antitoxin module
MKNFLFFPLLLVFSCASDENHPAESEQISTSPDSETNDVQIDSTSSIVMPEPTLAGDYQENYPNGKRKIEGKLNASGKRDGLWVSYYENGIKWSESYYDDGIKQGHSLSFFPNGQARYLGEYKNDKKFGTWKFYDEDGELFKEETF